jgi:Glycosyl transferase family 11
LGKIENERLIRMNKVSIYGGLGNQMFQYCITIALNSKGNRSKISVTNYLFNYDHNGINIKRAFKLNLSFPENMYCFYLLNFKLLYKNKYCAYLFRNINSLLIGRNYLIYKEPKEFEYDPKVLFQKNKLLVGTWQSENYLIDIEDKIKGEFIFNKPKDLLNKNLTKKIKECNSVGIHIRRGDYLKAEWLNTHFVIKDKTYYCNSIKYIETKISNPMYFIFSDDIEWAKTNLSLANSIYISHNTGSKSYIDMYLMSLCKHNIIANSTFSWWAAWLNQNPDKIVIAPSSWLTDSSCDQLFPKGWIRLATS